MLISVILCTYNPNESYLVRALDAIFAQDLNHEEWELIVIDNNSSVPIKERSIVIERRIRVEVESKQGLSAARECGMKHSKGNILVFVDDDNIMEYNYLSNVKNIFENKNIGIVSGVIVPEYEREPDSWFKEFESMLAIRKASGERHYLTTIPSYNEYFPIGAGMTVRRKIIEDYYKSISAGSAYISGRKGSELSSGEDIDLDFYAISQGFLVGTIATLKMKHIIPTSRTTLNYITRLAIASEKSTAQVNRKWKENFGMDVYNFFAVSRQRLYLQLIACFFLYIMPKFRIRYHVFKTRLDSSVL